jgi:NTP pyrophosphatase (non-canonical NTP hydrolase)
MEFSEYQKKSRETAIYPNQGDNFVYPTLGLVGESGEVAEKIKKIIRDNDGKMSEEKREELKKELGDVLWYLAQLSTELSLNFDEIADFNLKKLASRKERDVIHGNGDNR